MLQKWINHILYDSKVSLQERLFRIIILMGLAALIAAIFIGIALHQPPILFLLFLLGALFLISALWLSIRHHKTESASIILTLLLNVVFFPTAFFFSGGIHSGSAVWFVLGIILIFLLFSEKKFWVLLLLTMGSYLLTYYISYHYPELIISLKNDFTIYFDSSNAVIIVSIVIGLLLKFQRRIFEREKMISDWQKNEIEAMSLTKSAFFANMSHEIRTPINTIIGLNEMILREDISDEIAENSVHIQNASKMLLALINDILDLTKMETGNLEIVPVQYETGTMFSELVNIIWMKAHEKNLEFCVNISKDLPSMLYGDEIRIKQVLSNILTNAVKYTPDGSVTLTAACESICQNKILLKISVADTGIGIKKEDLSLLFDSFRRLDEGKNRAIEGTGLGLAISKRLLQQMGGAITVDSVYQKGSVFTITLEQDIIDESPMGSLEFMRRNAFRNRKKYQQIFEAPDACILIVDDNEMNLMVAQKLLRGTKVQVDVATSGKQCLRMTTKKYYHAIFMDHMMPEMDGIKTLLKLRQQKNGLCPETPVIALTANVIAGAEKKYWEYGFQGYLAKPINGILLEAALLKCLPTELIEEYNQNGAVEEDREDIQIITAKHRKKIVITTDCVCDLPEELLQKLCISSMHYYVYTSHGKFKDQEEITSDNLLEYIKEEQNTAYSEPASVQEYEKFFSDALQHGEQVIHISMAARSSKGYEIAAEAAGSFDNVFVVDSSHVSAGMGIIVMYAAKMALQGYCRSDILQTLEELKTKVSTSFIVPNLERMYKSGKVSRKMKQFCDIFNLHLILYLKNSKILPHYSEWGESKHAHKKYIRHQLKGKKNIDTRILFLVHSGCTIKQQKEILKEVEKYQTFEHVYLCKSSATISSNCGVGTFGLLFCRKL